MREAYDRFIDADRNRIEWVQVFRRAEDALQRLDHYSPLTAKRLRERFYDLAAQPLCRAEAGIDYVEYIEANLDELGPIPWEDAVRCSQEVGQTPSQVIEEHRLWALAQA